MDNMPFHIGIFPTKNNPDGLPNIMPFSLVWDEEIDLPVHKPTPQCLEFLSASYEKGMRLGIQMAGSEGLGRMYRDDFLSFIMRAAGNVQDMKILELGCGCSGMIKALENYGAVCWGMDPGRSCDDEKNIMKGFYPADRHPEAPFNMIIHYGVLEHIVNPMTFLMSHRDDLTECGIISFSVPDCGCSIQKGDLSCLYHQHISYFSNENLTRLLDRAGFEVIAMEKSHVGGAIYTAAKPTYGNRKGNSYKCNEYSCSKSEKTFLKSIKRFNSVFEKLLIKGESLGIYCPGRALNYLASVEQGKVQGVRFFDDEPSFHGLMYPPFPVPIENWNDLIDQPVHSMIIASPSFGDKIENRIKTHYKLRNIRVVKLMDIIKI